MSRIDILYIKELSEEAFDFEMYSDDDFGNVLRKYMSEQNLTVNDLAKNSGLSINSVVKYRAGHAPKDYIILVMLCIGLQVNNSKAEYLFNLAHFSLGTDRCSMVYRLLINLAFVSGITIVECNEYLKKMDFLS